LVSRRNCLTYSQAAALEQHLDAPNCSGLDVLLPEIVGYEELPGVPHGARQFIDTWDDNRYLVSVKVGGRVRSLDEVFLLGRVLMGDMR
jgi:hypothetical protein